MQTKVIRLTPEAEAVALQHGRTVSDGIMEMEKMLQSVTLQSVTPLQNVTGVTEMLQKILSQVTPAVPPKQPLYNVYPHDAAFWAQFRDEVRAAIPTNKTGFQPASEIPKSSQKAPINKSPETFLSD